MLTASHIERAFLAVRQELKRFSRRTCPTAKTLRFTRPQSRCTLAFYIFARRHKTPGATPAVAAGVDGADGLPVRVSVSLRHDRSLARQRGKIINGKVSGYDWLGFGLITGLGFWMFYCAQIALRETINRRSHPSWLWKGFAGTGFLLVLLAAAISAAHVAVLICRFAKNCPTLRLSELQISTLNGNARAARGSFNEPKSRSVALCFHGERASSAATLW